MRFVFAHGAGRAGADAWPEQTVLADEAAFITFPGYGDEAPARTDMAAWVARLLSVSMAEASVLDPATFWRRWMTALTGTEPAPVRTTAQVENAERFRLLDPPWSFDVPTAVFAEVPTLVLTAGWNQEYEDIADVLSRLGARRQQLPGRGHRLVDDVAATQLIRDWAAAQESEESKRL